MAKDLTLPELPQAKRARFHDEYALSYSDAKILSDDKYWADFTERVMSEVAAHEDVQGKPTDTIARVAGSFLTTKLMGEMAARTIDIRILKVSAENIAELIALISAEKITLSNALKILVVMLESGSDLDPTHVMEEKGYGLVRDENTILVHVERIIETYPKQVAEYIGGKDPVLQFLKGMVMKASEGTADPAIVEEMIQKKLRP
jgi:aspartyl-tRNA(Asn)/glutamyl-tRNA(Gln) amidotransferase subunit B